METPRPDRIHLLGGDVDLITPEAMLRHVESFLAKGRSAVIANHNAHSLYLCRTSPEMRAYFEDADLIEVDSTPMIAWGRLLGLPIGPEHRCTYLDWREDFWRRAEALGWRVFYLGGEPGVADAARAAILERWPKVSLASRHGYFDTTARGPENRAVLAQIAAFDPDILFVGMGMPRQELWIADNRAELGRAVVFSIGAAFDYEAGAQQAAPRWMGQAGIEWLFRLAVQPRRLGSRYLVEPWRLLPAAMADIRARLRPAQARRANEKVVLRPQP
jgi:N-acetylglucosaminyldiphosphoundecaprenol N-acetyl-beta-D-mannosaminyltransferase